QKMESIGTLVGGIAHDFNNMLAGITGNLYLARRKANLSPDLMQNLDNIEQLSVRAAEMIQQLLTFARKRRVSIKPISFNASIRELLKLIRASTPENIAIEQHICSDELKIRGDATLLHQVMMNLLSNAHDAVEAAGRPRIIISLDVLFADDAFVKRHVYFKAGSYAHLSVEDNGCGIPQEQMKHVFDPFFTTKEQGKGTGLGLSMVFGAVKIHHGFVEVESVQGKGTSFHIYLPLLEQDETATDIREQGGGFWQGHGETILLADDQQYVLEIGKEVLKELGYRVLVAGNGREAVKLFQTHTEDIDLCIFDLVMPEMGGRQAAELIRKIRPQAKIIFSTAYDKHGRDELAHETVISKPFAIEKMSRLIRQKISIS
ncbi:MAG: ATP-binding protein, partial [Mariprofundus sp.]